MARKELRDLTSLYYTCYMQTLLKATKVGVWEREGERGRGRGRCCENYREGTEKKNSSHALSVNERWSKVGSYCVGEHHVTTWSIRFYLNTPDAPFEAKYVLKALEPLLPSSPAYKMLKITQEVEFEDYLRKHPTEFSWKSVAEVLYRCGEETLLNQLFAYLKSPEGKCI